MGRHSQFTADDILDAALAVGSVQGFAEITVTAVAQQLQAPSGSIYYRYSSRDKLMSALWLRTQAHYLAGLLKALDHDDGPKGARRGAVYTLRWARANMTEARLLMLYRMEDLLEKAVDGESQSHLAAMDHARQEAIVHLAHRLNPEAPDAKWTEFMVQAMPAGALLRPLSRGRRPPRHLDKFVLRAVDALLEAGHGESTGS